MNLRIFNNTNNVYLTDVLSLPTINAVYVLTDDYYLREIKLERKNGKIEKATFDIKDSVNLK